MLSCVAVSPSLSEDPLKASYSKENFVSSSTLMAAVDVASITFGMVVVTVSAHDVV